MTPKPSQTDWKEGERARLEAEVAQRTALLRELALHLEAAREDERARLARDLHDELGALLTSAKLDAARIRARLGNTAPEALERLTHLVATLDSVIALKRRITENLRPSALSHLGLVATLNILAREFSDSSGLPVHCALEDIELKPNAELVAFRCVQEALTNLSKHAHAHQVWIAMAQADDHIEVSVRDDGVGFDTSASGTSAYGLVGMRFRVEAEGGTLQVDSALGRGSCIRMTLPPSARRVAGDTAR
jgi:signal transduction histidine kinase